MGAIFLYKKDSVFDKESVLKIFKEKGFDEPVTFVWNDYNILLYKKIHKKEKNYIIEGDSGLCAVGTIIYKGKNYRDSLNLLFSDLNNKIFDPNDLLGSFLILYKNGGKISFITDRANIQNIFYNENHTVISTSFLAMTYSFKDNVTVNKSAAIEILTTGTLIGPETFFNEIKRFDKDEKLYGLEQLTYKVESIPSKCTTNYRECLKDQLDVLDDYFKKIKNISENEGVDSGITGGHDSRLIMALALKNDFNISFNTHYRHNKNIEYDTAKELCKIAEVELKVIPVKDPEKMSSDEIDSNFNKVFLFFDGLVRMHSFWTEEYNSMEYRKKVLGNKNLGLSGIGGEQYRNEERFNRPSWDLYDTIKYKIILNTCGDCYKSNEALDAVIMNIEKKIRNKISLGSKKNISRLEYKRYLNEVFIPGRLAVRNNAENQLSFFLSPFTEFYVSNEAYKITYKLGPSMQFEEDMIKLINPEIASATSDHGFDFVSGEPFKNKIKSYLIDFVPRRIMQKYYLKITAGKDSSSQFKEILSKSEILMQGVERLKLLNLPIFLDKLSRKPDHMPLILATGFLLEKLKNKVSIN